MRFLVLLASTVLVTACASNKGSNYVEHIDRSVSIPAGTELALKIDNTVSVPFHGQIDLDDHNVDHGAMSYVGASPATFAASVLAHAVVAGAMDGAKKNARQEEADRVLEPYTGVIGELRAATLAAPSLETAPFTGWSEGLDQAWIVESSPVYLLSQDQGTLVLKNAVSVYSQDAPDEPAYQNLVEVISTPRTHGAIEVDALPILSTELFTNSLSAAYADLAGLEGKHGREETLQYFSGGKKVYERGRVIKRTCDRLTFRTLRGWLKSVPATQSDAGQGCLVN